jgi:putative aldouronate transport system permease protein
MKRKHAEIRESYYDRIFLLFVYVFIALMFIVTLYPIVFVFSASVSDPVLVATGKVILFPRGLTLSGYEYLSDYHEIWTGYGNSIFYTVIGTVLNIAVTLSAGYALSRRDMPGRNILMGIFIFTMYFSGGLIPGYLNVRSFGLLNTRTIMLIGGLLSVYNMIVCRTFFASTIPWELHEASQIDGASDFTIFFRIILPLSKPVMAVMALYYGVGHWNSYFGAMIYLRDRDKFPLQLFLREILIQSKLMSNAMADLVDAEAVQAMIALQDTANILKYCIIVIATLPMFILYPFLQRYFEKGILIGSIKG